MRSAAALAVSESPRIQRGSRGSWQNLRQVSPRKIQRSFVRPGSSESRSSAPERSLMLNLLPPMALFLTLVFHLWVRVELIETGYRIENLRQLAVNRDAEVRRLGSELAMLTTPRILSTRAKKELGMTLPTAVSVRKIPGRPS